MNVPAPSPCQDNPNLMVTITFKQMKEVRDCILVLYEIHRGVCALVIMRVNSRRRTRSACVLVRLFLFASKSADSQSNSSRLTYLLYSCADIELRRDSLISQAKLSIQPNIL